MRHTSLALFSAHGMVKMTYAKLIYTIWEMNCAFGSMHWAPLLSRYLKQAWEEEDMLFPPILSILATKLHWQNIMHTKSTQKVVPLGSWHPPVAESKKCATLLCPHLLLMGSSGTVQITHSSNLYYMYDDLYASFPLPKFDSPWFSLRMDLDWHKWTCTSIQALRVGPQQEAVVFFI